jgi:quercetin 2,3-dioxygenase
VNLPAKDKMTEPRYQDIPPEKIPSVALAKGANAKVIAGSLQGVRGPVETPATEPLFFDLTLEPGTLAAVPLPPTHNGFAYVYEGDVGVADRQLVAGMIGVLSPGDAVSMTAGSSGARLILVAGKPLNEPVAKYGPFVMNTQAELRQAMLDYQSGRF